MSDCAVLFIVMIGVVLIPISVGGLGSARIRHRCRFSSAHGIAPEQAFLFSLCFGLVFMIGRPSRRAAVYLLYPFPPRLISLAPYRLLPISRQTNVSRRATSFSIRNSTMPKEAP